MRIFENYRNGLSLLVLCFLSIGLLAQSRIYVDADATGNNDGTTWANAYTSLDSAINKANNNIINQGEVWVAEGVYTPAVVGSSNDASFNITRSAYDYYGGFDGTEVSRTERDPEAHPTILSGDILQNDVGPANYQNQTMFDNARHVVTSIASITFDGFIVERGFANGNSFLDQCAAGLLNRINGMTVRNCEFRHNVGLVDYSTVLFYAAIGYNTTFNFYSNKVHHNWSQSRSIIGVSRPSYNGRTRVATGFIYNNLFYDNRAVDAIVKYQQLSIASAVRNSDIDLYVYNNTFFKNKLTDTYSGAPILLHFRVNLGWNGDRPANVDVIGNIFWENDAAHKAIFIEDRSSISYTIPLERLYFAFNLLDGNDTLTTSNLNVEQNSFPFPSFIDYNIYDTMPMFTDTAMRDLSITACASPGVDYVNYKAAAMPSAYSGADVYGNPRSKGSRIDVGAAEVQNEAVQVQVEQQDTLLVATPGYAEYTWAYVEDPQNPIVYNDTTNILNPQDGDGKYLCVARDASRCRTEVEIEYCASVQVSLEIIGDSLVANGVGATHYNFGYDGTAIAQRTTNNKVALRGYGTYSSSHFKWNGNNIEGCVGRATLEYCGEIPNISILETDSSLSASVGDANAYVWTYQGDTLSNQTAILPKDSLDYGAYVVFAEANGCEGTSVVFNYSPVDVNEIEAEKINIYPNPANDVIYLNIALKSNNQVRIMDMTGSVLPFRMIDERSLDVSTLPKGAYLLQLNLDGQWVHKKLIVE